MQQLLDLSRQLTFQNLHFLASHSRVAFDRSQVMFVLSGYPTWPIVYGRPVVTETIFINPNHNNIHNIEELLG
jgi:hypothetical protein